jgi:sugar phosphate isomerase/epimerase
MHLKDWVHKGEEQILGEGDMDLVAVAKVLRKIKFTGPIMLEFELFEDDPVPGMIKGLENWKKAVAAA